MSKIARSFPLLTVLLLCALFLTQCKGSEKCGPGMSPLTDMDSDCVANESDNCPLIYNPDQGDGDDDGAGYWCDQDDQDDAVGPSQALIRKSLLDSQAFFVGAECYVVLTNKSDPDLFLVNQETTPDDATILCNIISCDELITLDIRDPSCD